MRHSPFRAPPNPTLIANEAGWPLRRLPPSPLGHALAACYLQRIARPTVAYTCTIPALASHCMRRFRTADPHCPFSGASSHPLATFAHSSSPTTIRPGARVLFTMGATLHSFPSFVGLAIVRLSNIAQARDPTGTQPSILKRLNGGPRVAALNRPCERSWSLSAKR